MAFSNKKLHPNAFVSAVRRHPFAFFGLPFISLVVVSSYALQALTSTRYELNDQKVKTVSKEDELGMNRDRKKVDIRDEYYGLGDEGLGSFGGGALTPSALLAADAALGAPPPEASPVADSETKTERALRERKARSKKKNFFETSSQDDYEPVRVPRPAGMPEWGAMPSSGDAPVKGARPEDRWV